MNWDEWNGIIHDFTPKHTTAEVVALRGRAAHPGGAGERRPRGGRVRAGHRAWLHRRRPHRHVPRAHAVVAHRRRGRAAADAPRRASASTRGTIVPRPPKAAATRERTLPLHGVKVLDLTAWWAGPSASAMLAALGADVIHVESVTRPDGMRFTSGVSTDRDNWWDYSALFHVSNTNKRDLTLDLARPEGRELALRLIEQCDMVVENYTPRVIEQFDLGWDVVHARQPACGDGAHARVRSRRPVARPPRVRADHGAGHRPRVAHRPRRRPAAHPARAVRSRTAACTPSSARWSRSRCATAPAWARWSESTMFEAALNISAELDRRVDRLRQLALPRGQPQPVGRAAGRLRDRHARALAGALGGDRRRSGRRWSTRSAVPTGPTDPALGHARRSARRARPARREARRVGRRHRPRQGRRPAGRRGRPRRAGVRRPRSRRSTRSSSPAATTRTSTTRSSASQPHPSLPFRYASVDRLAPHRVADARPAQPRDPHRPRPLRRGDRRPRSRRPDRHDPPGTVNT